MSRSASVVSLEYRRGILGCLAEVKFKACLILAQRVDCTDVVAGTFEKPVFGSFDLL